MCIGQRNGLRSAAARFGAGRARARVEHRSLHRAGDGRARRHGRGLRGVRPGARSQGRGEAAAREARQRRLAGRRAGSARCARRRRSRGCRTRTSSSCTTSARSRTRSSSRWSTWRATPSRTGCRCSSAAWREILKVFIGRGPRAGGRARQGPGPPRLQDRQRDGQPRPPRARHGLRARAPGAGEAAARRATPSPRRGGDGRPVRRAADPDPDPAAGCVGGQRRAADDGRSRRIHRRRSRSKGARARACSTRD